jgi:UDP-N-acetylmuramate--alanine ligase
MNYYKTTENLLKHFKQFISGVLARQGGYVVLNKDDQYIVKIMKDLPEENILYYSVKDNSAKISATNIQHSANSTTYTLLLDGKESGNVVLQVYGIHNVSNSLAAIGVGLNEGLSLEGIKQGLAKFSGTKRRFQLIGEINKIRIYDDYGHHPTEIKATLQGAKDSLKQKIICIFQPHRYSRTIDLMDEFSQSFSFADEVIITEIYSANELNPQNISAKGIVDKMIAKNIKNVQFIEKKSAIADALLPQLRPGDTVVTMGAGDIYTVGKELLARLKNANTAK